MKISTGLILFAATFPFAYYLIAIFSTARYFGRKRESADPQFTPPVSNLKPIRGLDPDAWENYSSLCRQDYPEYELLFCVGHATDPAAAIVERLIREFPQCNIRLIVGSGRNGTNDKVSKLARMVNEAKHEVLVINDSDVRVEPDYFRKVVASLKKPGVGAVTCFYVSAGEKTFADNVQTIGMMSDFFAGILVAWQLDGIKFALGTTIATTRAALNEFGGYESLENQPADDLLVGRMIAERHEVELLPYSVETVSDYSSIAELFHKRLRWIVVMRHMRPWGHFGLIFTHGLIWSLLAIAVHPTAATATAFLGTWLVLRLAMTYMIGSWGLKRRNLWKQMPLIPLWDAVAFVIWAVSFTRSTVHWRDGQYRIRQGRLVPVAPKPA